MPRKGGQAAAALWLEPVDRVQVDAGSTAAKIDPSKHEKGMTLRDAIMELETSARMSARTLLATASRLNSLQWIAAGVS